MQNGVFSVQLLTIYTNFITTFDKLKVWIYFEYSIHHDAWLMNVRHAAGIADLSAALDRKTTNYRLNVS